MTIIIIGKMSEFDESSISQYLKKNREIDTNKFEKKIRIAILSSFTINGLQETIRVKCSEKNIGCISYVGGYNQYNQEILDKNSKLYEFNPKIIFLFLDIRSILGELFYFPYSNSVELRKDNISKKIEEIHNLINTVTKNSESKIVVSNFSVPTYSSYGIYESKINYGLEEMVMDLNKQLTLILKDEPSVYVYDFNGFTHRFGENNVFDYRQYYFGDIKIALRYIPHVANDLLGYILPVLGKNRKCIVLDLDNTLWGGVVGEDGFDGIQLGQTHPGNTFMEFQRYLLSLNQRGIILAINSKNNEDDALKVVRDHPYMVLREDNFACMKINWNDKISNMKEIAEELNIGLDSFVYFDDDPVNREFMRKAIPEVLTIDLPKDPALFVSTLTSIPDLNVLKITKEDTQRSKMYRQQRKRNELKKSTTNLDEFLKEIGIKVKINKADGFSLPRVSQLTLKTNQFNLTTKRYQEEEIRKFISDDKILVGSVQVEDKFGDNGITGTFIIKKNNPKEWLIDTFLLSCRVMNRGVEDTIMSYVIAEAKKEGITKVIGQYIQTKKNKPCEDFLSNFGFVKNGEFWIYDVDKEIKFPQHIELKQ